MTSVSSSTTKEIQQINHVLNGSKLSREDAIAMIIQSVSRNDSKPIVNKDMIHAIEEEVAMKCKEKSNQLIISKQVQSPSENNVNKENPPVVQHSCRDKLGKVGNMDTVDTEDKVDKVILDSESRDIEEINKQVNNTIVETPQVAIPEDLPPSQHQSLEASTPHTQLETFQMSESTQLLQSLNASHVVVENVSGDGELTTIESTSIDTTNTGLVIQKTEKKSTYNSLTTLPSRLFRIFRPSSSTSTSTAIIANETTIEEKEQPSKNVNSELAMSCNENIPKLSENSESKQKSEMSVESSDHDIPQVSATIHSYGIEDFSDNELDHEIALRNFLRENYYSILNPELTEQPPQIGEHPVKLEHLQPGDHIYVKRLMYQHHGIYIGKSDRFLHAVVHFSPLDPTKEEKSSENCIIQETSMDRFLLGASNVYRKEYAVSYLTYLWKRKGTTNYSIPDSPKIVIERAKSKIGNRGYQLHLWNCEHFSHWCKTGYSTSDQVRGVAASIGAFTAATVTIAGLGIGAAALTVYHLTGSSSNGVSDSMTKQLQDKSESDD